jgi:hypothetical protein
MREDLRVWCGSPHLHHATEALVSHRNAPLNPTGRHSQRHPLDLRSPVSRVPDISFLTDTPIRSEPGRRAGPPRVPSRHLRNPSCRSRSMASHHRQSSLTRHRCSADVEPAKRPPRRGPGPRPLPRATLVGPVLDAPHKVPRGGVADVVEELVQQRVAGSPAQVFGEVRIPPPPGGL